MRFEVQIKNLLQFGKLSGGAKRQVNSDTVGQALQISANTAGLNNAFYVESGWLQKVSRGQYAATDELAAWAREVGFAADPEQVSAGPLASAARRSWYWVALEDRLADGLHLSRHEALVILAGESGAGADHKPSLEHLLNWLEFVGLVRCVNNEIYSASEVPASGGSTDCDETDPSRDFTTSVSGDAHRETNARDAQPTRQAPGSKADPPSSDNEGTRGGPAVLALDLSVRVTAEDLAALDADQIRAIFESVGTLAALTRR